MEKSRLTRCARPQPTDRHHTAGADCCRFVGIDGHIARYTRGAWLLCALGLSRRRIDVCRHQRLLWNGAPAGADAMEPPDRARGSIMLHHLLAIASGSIVGFVLGLVLGAT